MFSVRGWVDPKTLQWLEESRRWKIPPTRQHSGLKRRATACHRVPPRFNACHRVPQRATACPRLPSRATTFQRLPPRATACHQVPPPAPNRIITAVSSCLSCWRFRRTVWPRAPDRYIKQLFYNVMVIPDDGTVMPKHVVVRDYYLRHVCSSIFLSVPTEQLASHWTEFLEMSYSGIF
jgi:hypothetical protein